jgi:hypothetical protein
MYHLAPPDRYTKRARTIVGLILTGFFFFSLLVLLTAPPVFRIDLSLQVGLSMVWNCVLLGAIWQRQNWARYILCLFLVFSTAFGALVVLPQLLAARDSLPFGFLALLGYHPVALLVVGFNPTLRKFLHSR